MCDDTGECLAKMLSRAIMAHHEIRPVGIDAIVEAAGWVCGNAFLDQAWTAGTSQEDMVKACIRVFGTAFQKRIDYDAEVGTSEHGLH